MFDGEKALLIVIAPVWGIAIVELTRCLAGDSKVIQAVRAILQTAVLSFIAYETAPIIMDVLDSKFMELVGMMVFAAPLTLALLLALGVGRWR